MGVWERRLGSRHNGRTSGRDRLHGLREWSYARTDIVKPRTPFGPHVLTQSLEHAVDQSLSLGWGLLPRWKEFVEFRLRDVRHCKRQ